MPSGKLVQISALTHPMATFAPTGGRRVDVALFGAIQERIRECAATCGYPGSWNDGARRLFDAESGMILHQIMPVSPSEASREGVWAFLACVVLPDVVRWRFPGPRGVTTLERFLGGSRGLRNTFGRVWWRAYILHHAGLSKPYEYLELLGEDELVQITERPNLAGNSVLARQTCASFLEAARSFTSVSRSDLLREGMKRLRRLLPVVSFETLDSAVLAEVVDDVFRRSAESLSAAHQRVG
jgi:uncharacterized protein DUF6339